MCKLCKPATPLTDSSSFSTDSISTFCGVPAWEDRGRPTMNSAIIQKKKEPDWFSTLLTFHQYPEHILGDGQRRPNNKHGEEEGADGICCFVFRLGDKQERRPQQIHEEISEAAHTVKRTVTAVTRFSVQQSPAGDTMSRTFATCWLSFFFFIRGGSPEFTGPVCQI